jgi:signal transduction histidine kinase
MPFSELPRGRDLLRPSAWTSGLRTTGLVLLTISDTALAATFHDARVAFFEGRVAPAGEFVDATAGLYGLLVIALPVLVGFRRRVPMWVAVIGSVLTITFWLGPTVALIGLHHVILRRPRADGWRVGVAVTLATGLCTWRDLTSAAPESSFWGDLLKASPDMAWPVPVVVTAGLVGIPVGAALWTRTRSRLAESVIEVDTERRHVVDLTDQLSRQAERERIAREIHDGLGHRLSLLSVHAGALQAVAVEESDGRGAEEIRTSAALIRESASESMDELHHLLDLLRHPDDPDVAAPKVTLADVSRLVDDSVAAGMPLVATVFVDDAESLDPQHAQAAYRVVQELLTNARKHAPGIAVRLSVTGGPRTGSLDIATANHVLPGDPAGTGASVPSRGGTGLTGVRERIERLGGTMHSGLDPAGVFRTQIHLPWPS